jgi:hypothetical protein
MSEVNEAVLTAVNKWLSINPVLDGKTGKKVILQADPVNHPKHYTNHPSGIECIQITEHMGFNLGNAIKYIWRADLKADAIEDLKKSVWYIQREIAKREGK